MIQLKQSGPTPIVTFISLKTQFPIWMRWIRLERYDRSKSQRACSIDDATIFSIEANNSEPYQRLLTNPYKRNRLAGPVLLPLE
jgi:hypothetical protein